MYDSQALAVEQDFVKLLKERTAVYCSQVDSSTCLMNIITATEEYLKDTEKINMQFQKHTNVPRINNIVFSTHLKS